MATYYFDVRLRVDGPDLDDADRDRLENELGAELDSNSAHVNGYNYEVTVEKVIPYDDKPLRELTS